MAGGLMVGAVLLLELMKRNADCIPDPRCDAIQPVLDCLQAVNIADANQARTSEEDDGIAQPSRYQATIGRFALGLVAKQNCAAAECIRIGRAGAGSRT